MAEPAPRPGHPYYMHDAIYAQPGALRLVARGQGDAISAAAARLRALDQVLLTGVGTSWHAALVGELLFARVGGLGRRARAFHAFELARYWPDGDARTGVIGISHRGTNHHTLAALASARANGGAGVAVTGKGVDGAAADWTLRTVDQESSGAHTVSYTTALALLTALAAAVSGQSGAARELDAIPDLLASLLGQESWDDLAARYGRARHFWFVGGGPNTATALEAALKLNEAGHATAAGFNSSSQYLMTSRQILLSNAACATPARRPISAPKYSGVFGPSGPGASNGTGCMYGKPLTKTCCIVSSNTPHAARVSPKPFEIPAG